VTHLYNNTVFYRHKNNLSACEKVCARFNLTERTDAVVVKESIESCGGMADRLNAGFIPYIYIE